MSFYQSASLNALSTLFMLDRLLDRESADHRVDGQEPKARQPDLTNSSAGRTSAESCYSDGGDFENLGVTN